jgi:hypothetical protein
MDSGLLASLGPRMTGSAFAGTSGSKQPVNLDKNFASLGARRYFPQPKR